jgi:hypothetical protein
LNTTTARPSELVTRPHRLEWLDNPLPASLRRTIVAATLAATLGVFSWGTAGVMTTTPTFPGFPSGGTFGHYDQVIDLTQASAYNPGFVTASGGTISGALNRMLTAFAEGRAYFNIHTTAFPPGEIRGFLVPVPAPASAGVLGMAGLFAARRRRI